MERVFKITALGVALTDLVLIVVNLIIDPMGIARTIDRIGTIGAIGILVMIVLPVLVAVAILFEERRE